MVYYSGLIEEGWHIYASVNFAIIGSDNGLSPVLQKKKKHYLNHLLSIRP